jgi:hypothetical protein
VSLLSDIAGLKTRVTTVERRTTAVEAKNAAQGNARVALDGRSTNLEKEVDALTRIIISPTPAEPPSGPTFNVLDYGAHRNGSTDDAPHIQAAVNAAYAAGGGNVYLPTGTYAITTGTDMPAQNPIMKCGVNVLAGVTVYGDGIGQTILYVQEGLAAGGTHAIGSQSNNIGIRDLTSAQDPAYQSGSNRDGVKLSGCVGVTLTNVRCEYGYLGFNFIGTSDVVATGCVADTCMTGFMADLQGETWTSNNCTLSYCEAKNSINGGIPYGFALYVASGGNTTNSLFNWTLDHCTSQNNGQGGLYANWTNRLTITDCNLSNNDSYACYVVNTKDYWLAGNTATGNWDNSLPTNGGNSNARASL